MKKKVLASLLVASMVASMATACGSDESTESSSNDSGKTTITVMGPAEDLDEAKGAWLKTQCEAFAEEHPEWDIEFKYETCSESDAKDTVTKDPEGAADVFLYANDQIAALVDSNALSKLGGETAEYVKTSNSEAMAATVTYEGDIYGVPYTSNTWFMYYDKRVFSEDDVTSMEKMLEKGKVSFPLDNGWYLAAFYAANDCTIYGDGTDKDAGYDFGGEKGKAVTEYIANLVQNPNFVIDSNDGSVAQNGLADGTVNVYFNGNWNYDAVVEKLGAENVGVAPLPTININGEDKQMKAFLGSKAIGVNPNCENQEIAVKLAAYLGSADSQLAHFELRGQAPVNKDLANDEKIAADPVAATMAKVASDCSICQPIIDMSTYWDAATPFGAAFTPGAEDQITVENAGEKIEAFNEQLNGTLVE